MPLSFRSITSRDLLFVERLIRDAMPAYRVDATEVKRLLGHWPGQRGRLALLIESDERVGMVGTFGDSATDDDPGTLHLIGPFVTPPRRERVYLPSILYREMDGARALGAERLVAHRLQGQGVLSVSGVWPTIADRQFTTWRGMDLLAEVGFRAVGESDHMVLPASAPVLQVRLPLPYHIRPFDAERDGETVARVVYVPFCFVEYAPPPLAEGSALVVAGDHEVVGVVDWDLPRRELRRLAVVRERQGRGLGRALLTHAITSLRAQAPGPVHVHVDRQNARAVALFRSTGFEQVSTYTRFVCEL